MKHSLCSRDRAHGLARPRPFLLVFVVFLVLATILARESAAAPLAFPGAEGFGATVSGGRSGQVVHVTTLADSGTGSLRDAVSQGNRIVVFDVSGVIKITSQLVIAGDNVTLAGQSAPGDGIAIYGNGTSFSNRKNIIVRYLRFRQGINTGDGVKAVNITDGQNMIFDHVAVQWGRWDNFGITGTSSTVTLQNSIIGEGIDPQQFGSIIDSAQDITVAHNLWIDNESRNPKFKANGQYINNVVYDWGGGGGLIGGHSGADWYEDVINNYLIAGPAAVTGFLTFYASTDHVYQTGNLVDVNRNGQLDGRAIVPADFAGDSPPTFGTVAHNTPAVPVTVLSAADAYARVIAQAGTCQLRDGVELRLVAQLKSLGTTGAILTDETMVGGQPAIAQLTRPAGYDTDGDGMSDAWETAHGLNPKDASDGSGMNADGTTNVEAYLNSLADLACADATPTMPVVGDAGAAPPPADAAGPAVDAGATSGTDAASNDAATGGAGGAGGAGGSAGGGGAIRDASATGPGVPTSDAASARVDAGGLASTDAGPSAAGGTGSGGCACSTGVGGPNGRWGLLPLLTGLTLVLGRRRVRRR